MSQAVYCIAKDRIQAETIIERLRAAGFSSDQISVLLPDKNGTQDFAHQNSTKLPEGATTGGVAGLGIGAVLGWLTGIGALAIPGLGPFIAAGPIMAALSGAAVGGAAGGLIGGLIGAGLPEYEAKLYEGKVRDGNILISVHAADSEQKDAIKDIFEDCGAEDIHSGTEASVPS